MSRAMWSLTLTTFFCVSKIQTGFYQIGDIKRATYIGTSESVIQRKGDKNDTRKNKTLPYWNFINTYVS